jgi:hypothetical protein
LVFFSKRGQDITLLMFRSINLTKAITQFLTETWRRTVVSRTERPWRPGPGPRTIRRRRRPSAPKRDRASDARLPVGTHLLLLLQERWRHAGRSSLVVVLVKVRMVHRPGSRALAPVGLVAVVHLKAVHCRLTAGKNN